MISPAPPSLSKEDALRESERRFRALVEGALTGISIVQDGQVVYQNPEMKRLLGPLPRSSKLADTASIHPDDVVKVDAFHRQCLTGKADCSEIDFRFFPSSGTPSGDGFKWVNCRTSPIRYQGRDALLVNMMDITRMRQMEHLLRIQDKMTSLGRVAAGIAHEIRNPLSGINIYLDALEMRLVQHDGVDDKTRQILQQLRSASQKIESVVKRVLDFARPGRPQLVLGDVNKAVREAVDLSMATLRKNAIRLELRLASNLPVCRLDPQLIEEVILNLITNAVDALKAEPVDKQIHITSWSSGKQVRVAVADNGPGIPVRRREVIFDPFYTTKGNSTGIGLNLSRRIIADHGGFLTAGSRRGGGARFVIDLPAADRNVVCGGP
jgi:PAS domain S-box-containing protein